MNLEFDCSKESLLLCPFCHHEYVHHGKVEIFDRAEDAKTGKHTTCNKSYIRVDDDMKGNPSMRRHGIIIYCQCENCDKKFKLSIAQHKGQTFIMAE